MSDDLSFEETTMPYFESKCGQQPFYDSPEQLYEKVQAYFESCEPEPLTITDEDGEVHALTDTQGKPLMSDKKPTTYGLALFLGYADRSSLYDLQARGGPMAYIIKAAISQIGGAHEANLFSPSYGGSWKWLSNHGWTDKQTVEQTVKHEGEVKPIDRLKASVLEFFSKAGKPCPLYAPDFLTLLEGGRGGGKSYQLADITLALAYDRADTGTVVCGREIQKSLEISSYPLLKDRIAHFGLQDDFECLDNEIRCKHNGVTIQFLGMREATRNDGLKAIHKLFLFWGDEAQGFSQATLDVLIPTLIRVPGCRLFFSMNRQYDSDPVYAECQARGARIITINYYDNPYCSDMMRDEAETMKAANFPKWEHIYNGKPQQVFEDSLWPGDLIKKLVSSVAFSRDNYCRVVVSCDPAETNTEYSNEYGLHVVGKTHGGEGHHVRDESGRMSPNEFASKAIRLYNEYQADAIVVETNAGGDFIKSAILTIDPTVVVREVKAKSGQSKIIRATPIANLAQMGRIRHICGGSAKLENQMARMTNQGFKGAPGESPDRVDAYVWGFIDLFGLDEMQSTEMVFKASMFRSPPEKYWAENEGVCYTAFDGDAFGGVVFDIIKDRDNAYLYVKDYFKVSKDMAAEVLKAQLKAGVKEVHIPEDSAGEPLIGQLSQLFVGVSGIDQSDYVGKKLADRVIQILPHVKDGLVIMDKLPTKTYNAESGDLFTREVTGYVVDDKTPRPILGALCNAIFVEKGLA